MLPMLGPGSVACVSAVLIELIVVMTELIAELAVARTDCPCESASLEADTTPLSAVSLGGDRPIRRIVGGGRDFEAGRNLILNSVQRLLRHLQGLQRAKGGRVV